MPRFEGEASAAATIAAASPCDAEFFVVGGGGGAEFRESGQYGGYFGGVGQPHTIASGYPAESRARSMSL